MTSTSQTFGPHGGQGCPTNHTQVSDRAESAQAQVLRVEAFGKAYRAATMPSPPWESPAHLALSVGIGAATDVLNADYPADLLAPSLADAALDSEAGEMLSDAERRLVVFGYQLRDAMHTAKACDRG